MTLRGRLSNVMPADLLQTLEASGQSVEVRFDTALGRGKVWLSNSRLVGARMGHHEGEAAVFCLLGLREGVFEVQSVLATPKAKMSRRVSELVGQWNHRAKQWRELAARAIPLESILETDGAGTALDPSEAAIMRLVDGQRTALEVIDASGLDAVEGLRTIVTLCDRAVIRIIAPTSSAPPSSAPDTKRWGPSRMMQSGGYPGRGRPRTAYSVTSSERTVVSTDPPPMPHPTEAQAKPGQRTAPSGLAGAGSHSPPSAAGRPRSSRGGGTLIGHPSPIPAAFRPPVPGTIDALWEELAVAPAESVPESDSWSDQSSRSGGESLVLPPPLSISSDSAEPTSKSHTLGISPGTENILDPVITYHETELTIEDLRLIAEAEASDGDDPGIVPGARGTDMDGADREPPLRPTEDRAAHGDFERFVGRYEVLCRIGRGGMGSVYLCRVTTDAGFRRLFALKVLHASLSDSPDASDLFLQEASLLGWLNHPNVVGVVDAAIYQGQPYLVMDYVEGCSFHQLLKRSPEARTPRLVVSIVLEALAGLHAAHTLMDEDGEPLEIVHCDISPDNLLVGANGVCRLTDFGVARVRATAHRAEVTRGKPGYLSPEQVLEKPVDSRSDVFSLGVVLYNTLTGTRVFDGGTAEEILTAVLKAPIRPPSEVGLRPPKCLDSVCLRALERDPANRYQTAEAMLVDLRAVALRHELLALPSEVADWVERAVGEDLRMRRLACLDASRRSKEARPHPLTPSEMPPPLPVAVPTLPPDSEPPSEDMVSRTVVLPARSHNSVSRSVLVAAAALAVLFIALTIGWPGFAARLFTIDTGGFSTWGEQDHAAHELVDTSTTRHPAASVTLTDAPPTAVVPAASAGPSMKSAQNAPEPAHAPSTQSGVRQ